MSEAESKSKAVLLTILLCLAFARNLWAIDVPFSAGHPVNSAFSRFHALHVADVDGDGDIDILGASSGDDVILWWENLAGDGTSWAEYVVEGDYWVAVSVYGADLDGDGDMDILGAAYLDDDITWWENSAGDGTAWTRHTLNGAFDGAISVRAADVDGDGDLDVLGAAQDAGQIAWWENLAGNGAALSERTVDGNILTARSVHAADVDADGDMDIIGCAHDLNQISWWENTAGTGTSWSKHVVDDLFSVAVFVHSADVDGDGDLDIIGAAERDNEISWWENTAGDGTAWTKHIVDANFAQANSVHAVDVDEDGDVDIIGTALRENKISWFENTAGDGTAWTERTLDDAFDGISGWAADVDGDGDLDVLGAAFEPGVIAWWKNETPQPKSGFSMNPGMGGNWYKIERDGEGAQFELVDDGDGGLIFVATIYSYGPDGGQIFLIAVGPANGDGAEVDVFITEGGMWGNGFDPKLVNEAPWGSGTFTANGCDAMHMALRPNAEYQAMGYTELAYDMVRLAAPIVSCPFESPD